MAVCTQVHTYVHSHARTRSTSEGCTAGVIFWKGELACPRWDAHRIIDDVLMTCSDCRIVVIVLSVLLLCWPYSQLFMWRRIFLSINCSLVWSTLCAKETLKEWRHKRLLKMMIIATIKDAVLNCFQSWYLFLYVLFNLGFWSQFLRRLRPPIARSLLLLSE